MSRILIIEDDTDINNMMAEALRKAGYECTQAFSGTEGLLYIERDAFDLAVLDLIPLPIIPRHNRLYCFPVCF